MNLAEQFLSHPEDSPALVSSNGTTTYGALEERVARWRGGLESQEIGHGDRVVVVGPNDEDLVVAYLALLGIGAAAVPLNPQSPPAELAREVEAVQPRAAIVSGPVVPRWNETVAQGLDPAPALIASDALDTADPRPIVSVEPDDPAVLLFTSGTAGMPKPAVLTHGNIDASVRSMVSLPIGLLDERHVALAIIPLFHVFGLNTMINLGLRIGATIVLDDFRSVEQLTELVTAHEVTILAGPPTLWAAIASSPSVEPDQLGSVLLAISGAAKLDPALHGLVAERLDLDVKEGYGLTESCAVVATAVGTDAPVGSVGTLVPGIEARLVDDQANDVFVGDPGELWIRGPMVSPGYFERGGSIASNRDADGWLRTGDLAVVDEHGQLAIVDRVKDLVIVSGFNVFPGEVETVLRSHPTVAEAAVVGQPDPDTGESLVAHVVPIDGENLDEQAILDHCRAQLARYKVPGRIEVRRHLPLGLGGKIRRHELH